MGMFVLTDSGQKMLNLTSELFFIDFKLTKLFNQKIDQKKMSQSFSYLEMRQLYLRIWCFFEKKEVIDSFVTISNRKVKGQQNSMTLLPLFEN